MTAIRYRIGMETRSITHLRDAYADRPQGDTIEIELGESDIQPLAQRELAPVPVPQPATASISQSSSSLPHSQRRRWQLASIAGMLIGVTAFVAVASGALRTKPKSTDRTLVDATVGASARSPQPDIPPPQTVRFTNPFDSSEVFEFHAGTSEADARQAVAEILVQRARERGIPPSPKGKSRR
jgi:hypothetical protein